MFQINHIAMMYIISPRKNTFFSSSTHFSQNPFELVHWDLCGPSFTCTIEGFKYFFDSYG